MKLSVTDLTKKVPAGWSLSRVPMPVPSISAGVASILAQVKGEGDKALIRLTQEYDAFNLTSKTIRLQKKAPTATAEVRRVLQYALKNIQQFSKRGSPQNRSGRNTEGAVLSESYHPLERVGIYVPGGTAPLVSTVLMTVGVAKVAGVREIVVATPPPVNPALHYALELAGATEIYQIGGAQAIAALAYGTKTIRPVQKIFGPGNAYVVEAKRQVFGTVHIDLLPGPSEIAIVADESARADFIASDLLAQAEHGKGSQIVFLTDSRQLLSEVLLEIEEQLESLSRQGYLCEVLENHAQFILTPDIPRAIALVEDYAPEHLSLFIRKASAIAKSIRHAGAVFVGQYSPVAAGDYLAGPSHTLPTGGAGKAFAGLTIDQFYKRVSRIEYDAASINKVAARIAEMAELEKLDAHAASALVRLVN